MASERLGIVEELRRIRKGAEEVMLVVETRMPLSDLQRVKCSALVVHEISRRHDDFLSSIQLQSVSLN